MIKEKDEDFDLFEVSKMEKDGVPIYYKHISTSPVVQIRIGFNSGSFHDEEGKEGTAHFLEHMIFYGANILKNLKEVRAWSKMKTLNTFNAGTSYAWTVYTLSCFKKDLKEVMITLKDLIFHPQLRDEDIEHERKAITEESWLRYKNQKYLDYWKETQENLFPDTVLSRSLSPLGLPEAIFKINKQDLEDFHKYNYGVGNLFILLVGDIVEEDLEILNKFTVDLPQVKVSNLPPIKIEKPKTIEIKKRDIDIGENSKQTKITYSRALSNIQYEDVELYELAKRFIYDLLHEKLRDEEVLCYSLYFGLKKTNLATLLEISLKTDQAKIDQVKTELANLVSEITIKNYEEKFTTIKELYLEQTEALELTSGQIADKSRNELTIFSRTMSNKESVEQIKKVVYSDVIRITKEFFDLEYLVTEIILPE